jgi:YkoY family integral membrane protein
MAFEFPVVTANDLMAVGFLVFLEGVLSIDNALVLALIVRPLPKDLQKRALTYGLAGAIVFRIMAISAAAYLMHWEWVKFIGGAYLIYLALQFVWDKRKDEKTDAKLKQSQQRTFWMTVLVVELSDIMFAIDSILTAVALTRKLWVVITGGLLGLIAMRFAAGIFIQLLARFPRFEPTAYILVFLVGLKLLVEGFAAELDIKAINFHDPKTASFWSFWGAMLLAFCYGFVPHKTAHKKAKAHR